VSCAAWFIITDRDETTQTFTDNHAVCLAVFAVQYTPCNPTREWIKLVVLQPKIIDPLRKVVLP
jgi:hypothetical protein